MFTPRTALGRRHAKVIANSPVAFHPKLRSIAAQACLRRYDSEELAGTPEALDHYLDSEDFYYNR